MDTFPDLGPTSRTAAVQLRGSNGPLWAHIYWPAAGPPGAPPPPLLVFFTGHDDHEQLCRELCRRGGLVILAGPVDPRYERAVADAKAVVGWAADHATELEADPARLLVSGTGDGLAVATAVTHSAEQEGWPDLVLLTDLATTLERTNR